MRDPLISFLGEDSGAPGWLEPWLLGPLGLQEKVHKWRNTDLTPDFLKRNQGTWEDQHPVWEGKRKPWFWSPHLSSLGSHHSGWTLTNFNQNSQLSLILQIRTLGFPMNSDPPKATGGRTFFYNIFSIFRKWCLFLCTYITAVRLSECHLSRFPLSQCEIHPIKVKEHTFKGVRKKILGGERQEDHTTLSRVLKLGLIYEI